MGPKICSPPRKRWDAFRIHRQAPSGATDRRPVEKTWRQTRVGFCRPWRGSSDSMTDTHRLRGGLQIYRPATGRRNNKFRCSGAEDIRTHWILAHWILATAYSYSLVKKRTQPACMTPLPLLAMSSFARAKGFRKIHRNGRTALLAGR